MMYADYDFYASEYYGSQIQEPDFPRFASRASAYIWNYTHGLSDSVRGRALEQVKMCTCALADLMLNEDTMQKNAFAAGGVKTSESVGPWSRGYSSGLTAAATEYLDNKRKECLWLYLSNLPEFEELFMTGSYRCVHDAKRGQWP